MENTIGEQFEIDFNKKPKNEKEYENGDIFQYPTHEVDQYNDSIDGCVQVIDKEKGIYKDLRTGETISTKAFEVIPNKRKMPKYTKK